MRGVTSSGVGNEINTNHVPAGFVAQSINYLNNVIEQYHSRIKLRIGPMLGFKRFDTAAITISGIGLAAKIRKHEVKFGKLPGRPKTTPNLGARSGGLTPITHLARTTESLLKVLYVFLVLGHERPRIVHLAVTNHPTAKGTAQQMREDFPWDTAPRYLLRGRDRIFARISSTK